MLRHAAVLFMIFGLLNGQINFSTNWGKRTTALTEDGARYYQFADLQKIVLAILQSRRPIMRHAKLVQVAITKL